MPPSSPSAPPAIAPAAVPSGPIIEPAKPPSTAPTAPKPTAPVGRLENGLVLVVLELDEVVVGAVEVVGDPVPEDSDELVDELEMVDELELVVVLELVLALVVVPPLTTSTSSRDNSRMTASVGLLKSFR